MRWGERERAEVAGVGRRPSTVGAAGGCGWEKEEWIGNFRRRHFFHFHFDGMKFGDVVGRESLILAEPPIDPPKFPAPSEILILASNFFFFNERMNS
jgi:hypothetical protein